MLHHGVHHLPTDRQSVRPSADPKLSLTPHFAPLAPLPVDPAGAFIRLDVHLVQVHIKLGDVHLEAVGQKFDCLSNGAIAGSLWQRKQGLGSNGSYRRIKIQIKKM